MYRLPLPLLATLAAALLLSPPAGAAPKAELWEHWQAHRPLSKLGIDHGAWDALLQEYVIESADGVNRVRYAAITGAARQRLDDYLAAMQSVNPARHNRDSQFAYWINLYNALTLQVILDHYPVDSIRDIDISPGFFSDGPWKKKLLSIGGQQVSLDDIEHRILRPLMKDPRVHYAVNCASIGCPNLAVRAWVPARLDAMLDAAARDFVNHPRGVRIVDGELVVSSIYHWFKADFGGNDAGVIAHLKQYAAPELAAALEGVDDIDDHDYDWSLNAAAR